MSAHADFSLDEILPHRSPMRFLDAARPVGLSSMEAEWTPSSDSCWTDAGLVKRAAYLEFAAQTAAAWSGHARFVRDLLPVPGYLGVVDGFTFEGDAAPGERLSCRMDVRFAMGNAVRVACTVSSAAGRILARGEMSLASLPEPR